MAETRIYLVRSTLPPRKDQEQKVENCQVVDHLVEARSKADAYRHVCGRYVGDAQVATGKTIAELVAAGVKLETAGEGGGA